nr:DUF3445 domain-containing protein [Pseudooceanicola onchidii]
MTTILQSHIPYDISAVRLPGVSPMDGAEWLLRDDAFAGQMALRDRLIAERREDVIGLLPEGRDAAQELLALVLDRLVQDDGYDVGDDAVTRPDGVAVMIDREDPLGTAGRLVQEDLCLMQKAEGAAEHVLTGAALCFPAGWMLAEKLGRPLIRIHKPVIDYDDDLARRVQRLFDGVRVGRPMWRFNALRYADPALFQPRHEGVPKYGQPEDQRFIRSERQTILRLPGTDAVVFGIHTFVVADQKNGR